MLFELNTAETKQGPRRQHWFRGLRPSHRCKVVPPGEKSGRRAKDPRHVSAGHDKQAEWGWAHRKDAKEEGEKEKTNSKNHIDPRSLWFKPRGDHRRGENQQQAIYPREGGIEQERHAKGLSMYGPPSGLWCTCIHRWPPFLTRSLQLGRRIAPRHIA